MLTRAHRENIFMILSSKLEKEDAIELEKDISVFVMELYNEKLKSEINVNNIILNGDRIKNFIKSKNDYNWGYGEGAQNLLKIKINSLKTDISNVNEDIIKILK